MIAAPLAFNFCYLLQISAFHRRVLPFGFLPGDWIPSMRAMARQPPGIQNSPITSNKYDNTIN
jgi:hypothetical protein